MKTQHKDEKIRKEKEGKIIIYTFVLYLKTLEIHYLAQSKPYRYLL